MSAFPLSNKTKQNKQTQPINFVHLVFIVLIVSFSGLADPLHKPNFVVKHCVFNINSGRQAEAAISSPF